MGVKRGGGADGEEGGGTRTLEEADPPRNRPQFRIPEIRIYLRAAATLSAASEPTLPPFRVIKFYEAVSRDRRGD